MQTPPYLKSGDTIAIVATARKITPEEILPSINLFKQWGINVLLGDNIYQQENQFAGTDSQRLSDFQQMLDDKNVKAIICARGGYGTVRILDKINFTEFIKNPKWIVGYSDITFLHAHIQKHYNIMSLHATMPINFPKNELSNESTESLRKALFGEQLTYTYDSTSDLNSIGESEGEIIGGNLSILYSLNGTSSQIQTQGKILFIEDLDEYLYHIDRMILNLKRSGMLDHLAGLIVGGMSEMRDNLIPFGNTAEQIIKDAVKEYDYPVCFNFPVGHIEKNLALYIGKKARLNITLFKTELQYK